MVAMMAETRTVRKSRNIQSLTLPCELRDGPAGVSSTHSDGEATEAETRCQKSDVAIMPSANLRSSMLEIESGDASFVELGKEQNAYLWKNRVSDNFESLTQGKVASIAIQIPQVRLSLSKC